MTPDLRALADRLDDRAALVGWPERIPIAAALRSAADTIDAQRAGAVPHLTACKVSDLHPDGHAYSVPDAVSFALGLKDTIDAQKAENAKVREILAGADYGSLPNDWTLDRIAEARMDDISKLTWQVRDTCARAEKAEAEIERLKGETQWQPIETAPTNQRVLVFAGTSELCMAWLDLMDSRWYHVPRGTLLSAAPTHWMPLPKAPT